MFKKEVFVKPHAITVGMLIYFINAQIVILHVLLVLLLVQSHAKLVQLDISLNGKDFLADLHVLMEVMLMLLLICVCFVIIHVRRAQMLLLILA